MRSGQVRSSATRQYPSAIINSTAENYCASGRHRSLFPRQWPSTMRALHFLCFGRNQNRPFGAFACERTASSGAKCSFTIACSIIQMQMTILASADKIRSAVRPSRALLLFRRRRRVPASDATICSPLRRPRSDSGQETRTADALVCAFDCAANGQARSRVHYSTKALERLSVPGAALLARPTPLDHETRMARKSGAIASSAPQSLSAANQ